jgi:CPA2 family monovalent cation:H+ antiporter-2
VEGDSLLAQLLILLAAALIVGTIFERLKQSALVGYLLAGMLVGPNVLGFIAESESITELADLGVALLMFTIGLEFSFKRLRKLGRVVILGGSLQVIITTSVAMGLWMAFGMSFKPAFVLGAMAAMSSTSCMLHVLASRAAIDSVYGRDSVGISILQDVSVIPLTLAVTAMAVPEEAGNPFVAIGRTFLFGSLLVGGFVLLFNVIVPRLLNIKQWSTNRELPILLAILMAVGAAVGAHAVGLSPSIGAFLAGVLLAASPFSVQIQADIASAKTVLVTIFFASVGILADPAWAAANAQMVVPLFLAVIVLKALIVFGILWALGGPPGMALATGLCIANVGEFSFVLGRIAESGGLFDETTSKLTIASTTLTLLATPYLVQIAPRAAGWVESIRLRRRGLAPHAAGPSTLEETPKPPVLLVGFGPAGQRIAEALLGSLGERLHVLEINPRNAARAADYGLIAHIGDGQRLEVLEHIGIRRFCAVAITVPDPAASRSMIHLIKTANPGIKVIARARYHVSRWELQLAGADLVVDEEEQVGLVLAGDLLSLIESSGNG